MQEMIAERRAAEVKEERYDLFNALLDANNHDGEKGTLSDSELIGTCIYCCSM
jgi:cytochrome P450